MENYFQAEAFNLDKVLDEFEQNEDEADAPTLSDAKWTQILAPPSHLLSFSPALAHADLSPLNLKPPPESPGGPAGDLSMTGGPDPTADERPPAQPNIGKLVGVDSLENGAPPSPALNGCAKGSLSDDGPHQVDDPPCCAGSPPADDVGPPENAESYFKDSYFSLEDGSGSGDLPSASVDPSEPPEHSGIIGSPKGEHNLEVPAQPEAHADPEGQPEMLTNGGTAESSAANQSEELEGESSTCTVPNGLEALEPGPRCPRGPPSKEEFVTEEKEVEESKQECSEQARGPEAGATLGREDGRQQPVSVPYGGARPKQPAGLKLQIPRSLLGHNQSQSHPQDQPGPQGKNKNQDPRGQPGEASCPHGYGEQPSLNGERASSGPSGPVTAPESPDNDIQAGHLGALSRKPFSSLGEVAPVWVPDSQAPVCMKCEAKFTFTKRRHHCRACGKVFCAACCSLKCRLMYMDRKEARVCVTCHSALMTAQSWENASGGNAQTPNPNNPAEYCSTVPPLQQARASGALSSPPPTVMVPVGVLKHPGTEGSLPREQRRVWFADGILPNGEVADSTKVAVTSPPPSGPLLLSQDSGKPATAGSSEAVPPPAETAPPAPSHGLGAPVGSPVGSSVNLIPDDGLPPILISTGVKGDYAVEERPSEILMMQQLEEGTLDPLVFVLNANLLAMVKLVNYVNRKCWCVTTKGMHAVGQAEVVVLLQCLPDEKSIPRDIFSHFVQLYREALTGNVVTHLGHSFFTQSFLGSREHGGFLYINPTFQSLQDLLLPNPPYLFGILIQKWETPWAKVFPIRLMLRLGAEYRFYPCPLFSVRFRKPLFGETGHTIMNLLADFRNYQYTLPVVTGLVVDLEVRRTCIKIPSNRYNELMKAMNKSNEHVLAIGACFNERADSHLVCVQNDDGNYQTQAISIHNQPRKVTGACFFVFSGALKVSSGYLAKSSIVEDGVMVQITAETMEALRQALREMKDFTITCGKADQQESQEHVHIQWLEDDRNFNKGVISPIDGRSMESITSVKIFHGSEYKANGKVIRWTEVFFLQSDDQSSGLSDPADHSRLTENMARAFCVALCPHLKLLKEDGLAKLGLRVTLDSDQVGYLAGSNGQPLLPQYMNDLDSALVPVIHSGACQISEGPVVIELIFYILENIS